MNDTTTSDHADTFVRTLPTRPPAPPPTDYGLAAAHYSRMAADEREGRLRAERRARRWRTACLLTLAAALVVGGGRAMHYQAVAAGVALVCVAVLTANTEGQR